MWHNCVIITAAATSMMMMVVVIVIWRRRHAAIQWSLVNAVAIIKVAGRQCGWHDTVRCRQFAG